MRHTSQVFMIVCLIFSSNAAMGIELQNSNDSGTQLQTTESPEVFACCLQDLSCIYTETEEECYESGGCNMLGPEYSCDPNPCIEFPNLACCFDDNTCEVVCERECIENNGIVLEDTLECDPDPCTPAPTQEMDWGSIKTLYN